MAMRRMKRALSLRDRGKDDSLSELAEQLSLDVNGKEDNTNGETSL